MYVYIYIFVFSLPGEVEKGVHGSKDRGGGSFFQLKIPAGAGGSIRRRGGGAGAGRVSARRRGAELFFVGSEIPTKLLFCVVSYKS